ncbi:MAG: TlpA family protein disulfide reductase [Planctomycetes bacterium]|nr:TlpA family protein disulfide reductase [Planctomycetota bacterium]
MMMPIRCIKVSAILLLLLASSGADLRAKPGEKHTRGIVGRKAPNWDVERWFNLPEGVDKLDVGDFKGKVVYMLCFQSWCPGCHTRGFPTLQKMIERYKGQSAVAFVAVQTTFEGFSVNSAKVAETVGQQYGLKIPIGHTGSDGKRSGLMERYRTGGTPWIIVIDRDGVVRFNDFHLPLEEGAKLIDRLVAGDTSDR